MKSELLLPRVIGSPFYFMTTYKINLKADTIDFYNRNWLGDYWLPLQMFKIENDWCEGINNLSEKNWVSNQMLYSIGKDLKKLYAVEYETIITNIIKSRDEKIKFINDLLLKYKYHG